MAIGYRGEDIHWVPRGQRRLEAFNTRGGALWCGQRGTCFDKGCHSTSTPGPVAKVDDTDVAAEAVPVAVAAGHRRLLRL